MSLSRQNSARLHISPASWDSLVESWDPRSPVLSCSSLMHCWWGEGLCAGMFTWSNCWRPSPACCTCWTARPSYVTGRWERRGCGNLDNTWDTLVTTSDINNLNMLDISNIIFLCNLRPVWYCSYWMYINITSTSNRIWAPTCFHLRFSWAAIV